jgi:hypothetical protein
MEEYIEYLKGRIECAKITCLRNLGHSESLDEYKSFLDAAKLKRFFAQET